MPHIECVAIVLLEREASKKEAGCLPFYVLSSPFFITSCDVWDRMGASDNLAAGRSTFLVEMLEAADVLTHATPRSLVILDEVSRHCTPCTRTAALCHPAHTLAPPGRARHGDVRRDGHSFRGSEAPRRETLFHVCQITGQDR